MKRNIKNINKKTYSCFKNQSNIAGAFSFVCVCTWCVCVASVNLNNKQFKTFIKHAVTLNLNKKLFKTKSKREKKIEDKAVK